MDATIARSAMTPRDLISPTHRTIRKYYENLRALRNQNVLNEMNVRSAFEFLLADTAKLKGWTFVPELSEKAGGSLVRPDGTNCGWVSGARFVP